MRTYTAHLHHRRPLVLVPEAFSWAALFFGPLWLVRHRAWIAALLLLAALALACTVPPAGLRPLCAFGVLLSGAQLGNDARRWELRLRRFRLAHVVAGRTQDEALFRLLTHRSDLPGWVV